MMKKNGFTLAEVLITLAIIGVVATLTLPALISNTNEQQAKTAFKKGINTLTEAAQMNAAIEGFDYSSLIVQTTTDQETQSLYGLLAKRVSLDYDKNGKSEGGVQPTHQGSTDDAAEGAGNYTVFFRDGASLTFPTTVDSEYTNPHSQKIASETMDGDSLPYGIAVLYDTNGVKGPNILSNCGPDADALGAPADNKQGVDEDLDKYCAPKQRVIKDQFGIRLRGGYAVPNGAASRWAFEN